MQNLDQGQRLKFGLYEVNLESREIWKSGHRVRLQDLPFRILAALLTKPGQVVTHSELQLQIWGADTNIDFERALAVAIQKIREALSDSAENPRFVETLARRGYRFIAPISVVDSDADSIRLESDAEQAASPSDQGSLPNPKTNTDGDGPSASATSRRQPSWNRREILLALASALLLCAVGVLSWQGYQADPTPLRIEVLTHDSPVAAGPPGMENLLTLATDGQRIFTSSTIAGRSQLAAIDISTGEVQTLSIPSTLNSARVADISRDRSHLLLRSQLSFQSEQPIWIVPTAGGSALRVGGVQAQDATWMPDGTSIVVASGMEIKQISLDGATITSLAKLPGRAFWLRWSPDGSLLRFTLMDPLMHTSSLWELKRGSKTARPMLKNSISKTMDCCGNWTADGTAYIFQAIDSTSNLWELKSSGRGLSLTQLTNGPLSYSSPIAARSGHRIFFYGADPPAGVQRYLNKQLGFRPEGTFLADGNRIDYSRDHKWVAWTDFSGRLWRARSADGSDKIQLTPSDFEVFSAQWSPAGSKLAIMARRTGEKWGIYIIGSDGGRPELMMQDNRNIADPSWSADGWELAFGREPDSMGKDSGPSAIEVFNLHTQQRRTIPHSEGLFSPRWSPDGKWIAALSLAQNKVMLFDVANQRWRELASTSAADPVWSSDSKDILVHAFQAQNQPIIRISVPDGQMKEVANSADFHFGKPEDYFFGGLTPEGSPLVRPRVGTGNLFTMDLDRHY